MKLLPLSQPLRNQLQHIQTNGEKTDPSLFPDFLIIGPQRTGTTWLFHNLKHHPQIFLPRKKEAYYFSTLGKPDHTHFQYPYLENYLASMQDAPMQWIKKNYDCLRKYTERYRPQIRGEATATYAKLSGDIIAEICLLNPNIKAILMLRAPIDRTWSHAKKDLVLATGRAAEDIPKTEFEKFFRASGQRKLASYSNLIENWNHHLKPGHLFLGDFNKIATAPEELIFSIHKFLGARTHKKYFHKKHLKQKINPTNSSITPPAIAEYLEDLLQEEIESFQQIIQSKDTSPPFLPLSDLPNTPLRDTPQQANS